MLSSSAISWATQRSAFIGLPSSLASLGVFVALALENVLFPRFSSWNEEGKHEMIATSLSRAYTYSLVLAIPFCVGGWLLADKLLYYLYGEAFTSGTYALLVLLPLYVIYVFQFLQMMTLNALNHPKDSFWITSIIVLVNIVLNILLIPVIGITGAAIATLISILISAILGYLVLEKIHIGKDRKEPVTPYPWGCSSDGPCNRWTPAGGSCCEPGVSYRACDHRGSGLFRSPFQD